MVDGLEVKARRRIKRFIRTGNKQARVAQIDENTFVYNTVHHKESLTFKKDKIGRLRLIIKTVNIA